MGPTVPIGASGRRTRRVAGTIHRLSACGLSPSLPVPGSQRWRLFPGLPGCILTPDLNAGGRPARQFLRSEEGWPRDPSRDTAVNHFASRRRESESSGGPGAEALTSALARGKTESAGLKNPKSRIAASRAVQAQGNAKTPTPLGLGSCVNQSDLFSSLLDIWLPAPNGFQTVGGLCVATRAPPRDSVRSESRTVNGDVARFHLHADPWPTEA
jgi:hypothetical protein